MLKQLFFLLVTCFFAVLSASSQKKETDFKFAFISDTHIGSATGAEDLRRVVNDINADSSLKFVVHTGDVTEFGADAEIRLAKQILDSLNKPLYIVPGNHDANWSESGANSFRTIFGKETFAFNYGGYLFVATGSGPNMRMGPGQIPHEGIVWLDSTLEHMKDKDQPVVYLEHYPLDSGLNNWYDAIDLLKKHNVQLVLNGHWHRNTALNTEGIPAIAGRSTLRANSSIGGYNIVHFHGDSVVFEERTPGVGTKAAWAAVVLKNHHFEKDTTRYARPSYSVNNDYPAVKTLWQYTDKSDIGTGVAEYENLLITTNTNGWLLALGKNDGRLKWKFPTGGKIYSTPATQDGKVVVASTDKNIYCVNALSGKLIWKYTTGKPDVACPLIANKKVYIGGSDGHFRCFDLEDGKLLWDFGEVKGFMVDRPLMYRGKIYFGCWANDFYALDAATGALVWKWNNNSGNRMLSAAACWPVGAGGRVFIVAPDQRMTAFNADNGTVLWRKHSPEMKVRESMGLSSDSTLVYTKTMQGELCAFSTTADSMQLAWHPDVQLGYEICPSPIVEKSGVVYLPTGSGLVVAVSRQSGKVIWKYKVSNCLVNSILPLDNHSVIISTMDGKVSCLAVPRS